MSTGIRNTLAAIVLVFLLGGYSHALELSDTAQLDHHGMWHKLKRGFVNVLTSPVEIPKQLKRELTASGNHPAEKITTAFGGTIKGLVWFAGRLGSGIYDVVTFNLAIPEYYDPLMKPEFVIEKWNHK